MTNLLETADPATWGIGAIIMGAALYFAPTVLAITKRDLLAIFALNLLLGWTFIGWVVALVWALIKDSETSVEVTKRAPTFEQVTISGNDWSK